MKRRQFNYLLLSGASAAASGSKTFFFPKPAEAFQLDLSLQDLSSPKFFSGLQRYAGTAAKPGVLTGVLQGQRTALERTIPGISKAIREADSNLVRKSFTQKRTELAESRGVTINRLWARQKSEDVGVNVGTCFLQSFDGDFTTKKLSGPFTAGIHQILPVLFHNIRLQQPDIAKVLLPVRSLWDDPNKDDLSSWFGIDGRAETIWWTGAGHVRCQYNLKEAGSKGFGEVYITMEAEDHPRRNFTIRINFNDALG